MIQGGKPQDGLWGRGENGNWKIHSVALIDELNSGSGFTFPTCVLSSEIKKRKPPMRTCGIINHPSCC